MANTYTYTQQLLVDCLKELYRIDPEQNDYDGNYIFDVERDIELALEHLYDKNSPEYKANLGLLTGSSGNATLQPWRVIRARKKIQQIINSFHEQTSAEPKPEIVIEIIIQVFIDLENLRRQQSNEPPMTEEEETSKRGYMWKFFESAYNTLRNGGDVAQLMNQYIDFFRLFLPPPS